jgi:hypothetical protein
LFWTKQKRPLKIVSVVTEADRSLRYQQMGPSPETLCSAGRKTAPLQVSNSCPVQHYSPWALWHFVEEVIELRNKAI